MKILFVIHDFLPRHRAGSEIYAYLLARELSSRQRTAVFYVDIANGGKDVLNQKSYRGVPCYELRRIFSPAGDWVPHVNAAMEQVFEKVLDEFKPDLVHFHHLMLHSLNYPAILKRRGIPSVFTLHDFFLLCPTPTGGQLLDGEGRLCPRPQTGNCVRCLDSLPIPAPPNALGRLGAAFPERLRGLFPTAAKAWALRAQRLLDRFHAGAEPTPQNSSALIEREKLVAEIFNGVELFIAPSKFLRKIFIESGVPESKIIYSDNGIDKRAFSPKERGARREEMVRFGFVGTPAFHKGLAVLIDAFLMAGLDNAELLVYGDPAIFPLYTGPLMKKARKGRISFEGGFAPEKAAEIFGGLDALVAPSIWYENSPLTIHEAFLSGTPVIASDAGGMAELVSSGVNGLLFELGDAADLARKLRLFAGDRSLRKTLSEGAAAFPIKSIAEDAGRTERIYRGLIDRRSGGPGRGRGRL